MIPNVTHHHQNPIQPISLVLWCRGPIQNCSGYRLPPLTVTHNAQAADFKIAAECKPQLEVLWCWINV